MWLICFNKGLNLLVQSPDKVNIQRVMWQKLEHWPSGSTLTTTGSSTHRLLTEIQEPMANRAISPWVTAALLHQLPHMVPLNRANTTKKVLVTRLTLFGLSKVTVYCFTRCLNLKNGGHYAKFPPLQLPSGTPRKFLFYTRNQYRHCYIRLVCSWLIQIMTPCVWSITVGTSFIQTWCFFMVLYDIFLLAITLFVYWSVDTSAGT